MVNKKLIKNGCSHSVATGIVNIIHSIENMIGGTFYEICFL